MNLGQRLKIAREHAKLTQIELAERSGVKQQVISKIERGMQHDTGAIIPLARACGISPYWLDSGEGGMTSQSPTASIESLPELIRDVIELMKNVDLRGQLKAKLAVEDVIAMHRAVIGKTHLADQDYDEPEKLLVGTYRTASPVLKKIIDEAIASEIAKKTQDKAKKMK